MKNIITLIVAALFAVSCNTSPSAPAAEGDAHEAEHTTASANKTSLTLNNGEKWKADESTNNNVAALEQITNDFKPVEEKSTEDYKALHTSLQEGIEKMVKECRMQGADHDALHLWLEPLMGMVKRMENVASATEGSASFEEINNQINLYRQYFA